MKGFIKLKQMARIRLFSISDKLLVFIIAFLFSFSLLAKAESTSKQQILPGNFYSQNNSSFYALGVDKKSRMVHLLKIENDIPKIEKTFNNILVGKVQGDKTIEGDMKTPEGIYYITSFIPGKELPDIYGFGAFPLNYPNFYDKLLGKTGYGIWIHGKNENDPEDNTTEGCVALKNSEIKNLTSLNMINTPVVISKELKFFDRDRYFSERAFWLNFLHGFIDAWQNNDADKFQSYLHTNFQNDQNQDYYEYVMEKKRLMKMYPYRHINIDNIKIFVENDSEVVFDFNQLYCADNIISEGRKKIFLSKEFEEYKIVAEKFYPSNSLAMTKQLTKKFIKNWKEAWQSEDISKYSSFYGQSFQSSGMDYEEWMKDKEKKFERYENIEVEVSDITLMHVEPKMITVQFKQRFKGDNYSDYGVKTLVLSGCPGDFSIIRESWRAL